MAQSNHVIFQSDLHLSLLSTRFIPFVDVVTFLCDSFGLWSALLTQYYCFRPIPLYSLLIGLQLTIMKLNNVGQIGCSLSWFVLWFVPRSSTWLLVTLISILHFV